MARASVSPDALRAALGFLTPDLDRASWLRILMGVKFELGEGGRDLALEWSRGGKTFSEEAFADTWKSVARDGGGGGRPVTGATVIRMAKAAGFRVDRKTQGRKLTEAEVDQKMAAKRAAGDEAKRLKAAAQKRAATLAQKRWAAASVDGTSSYLEAKAVNAYALRFEPGGSALVPMRDIDGKLWGLQVLLAEPMENGDRKKFTHGQKSFGCLHWLGVPDGADVLLLGEGYATCASVHEATGLPIACAFNAGSLAKVAADVRRKFPKARLLVCADDDQATMARTGKNPGVDAATTVASKLPGVQWVLPEGLSAEGSDFNDLHMSAGLDEVRRQILLAVGRLESAVAPAAAPDPQERSQNEPAADGGTVDRPKGQEPAGARTAGGSGRFELRERVDGEPAGVFARIDRPGADGGDSRWARICGPLEVLAESRDADGRSWGVLVRIVDRDDTYRQWLVPGALLAGDGVELRKALRERGLWISPNKALRDQLVAYLETRFVKARVRTVPVVGWCDGQYVMPDQTLNPHPTQETAVFAGLGDASSQFRQAGSFEDWRDQVAALCVGNSRLIFAVSVSFAATLLGLADEASGGFHIKGPSSEGKTSALRVAASVFGAPGYTMKWRATANSLEAVAAQFSDAPLILDELGMLEANSAVEVGYMLAEGVGKTRMHRTATLKDRQSWRVMVLSSGEIGFADLARDANRRLPAGAEVRFAEFGSDAGAGLGLFEDLHDFASPAAFAENLSEKTARHYGVVGRRWLDWLILNLAKATSSVQTRQREFARDLAKGGGVGQVSRVARRFALVGVAGEMATYAGMTGWPTGVAYDSARQLFKAWLDARGGAGRSEDREMLAQVRRFLEAHGEGRFTWWDRARDDRSPKTLNRAGFRRRSHNGIDIDADNFASTYGGERMTADQAEETVVTFYILVEVFEREVCAGFNPRAVAELLRRLGCLEHDPGRLKKKPRLPMMGSSWCYVVTPKIFEVELE